jgi:hypothetical protein
MVLGARGRALADAGLRAAHECARASEAWARRTGCARAHGVNAWWPWRAGAIAQELRWASDRSWHERAASGVGREGGEHGVRAGGSVRRGHRGMGVGHGVPSCRVEAVGGVVGAELARGP